MSTTATYVVGWAVPPCWIGCDYSPAISILAYPMSLSLGTSLSFTRDGGGVWW